MLTELTACEIPKIAKEVPIPLIDRGLTASGWPIVRPWPEVQQYEILMRQDSAARAEGVAADDRPQEMRLPTASQTEGVELPWIRTSWGALRLHPMQAVAAGQGDEFVAQIDIHLDYVRARRSEASKMLPYLRKSFPKAYRRLLTDAQHPLASGGFEFRGAKKEIAAKFRRFCHGYERVNFLGEIATAICSHADDEQREVRAEDYGKPTVVDDLVALADDNPELFAKLEAAAGKLRAARTPEHESEFEKLAIAVDRVCHSYCEPTPDADALADELTAMCQARDYRAMVTPAAARETPWKEVLDAEREHPQAQARSDWTDEHWLRATWGVLRLRFCVSDGIAKSGIAQFLFRDARFEARADELTRVGALVLAQRYADLPMQWPVRGQPIFSLGVNDTLDADLGKLGAMVTCCYAEDILYSRFATEYDGGLAHLPGRQDATFMSFVAWSQTQPRSEVFRYIEAKAVARQLRAYGLSAGSWPMKKPWPEVQQFEMAVRRDEAARAQGLRDDDRRPLSERLPTPAEANDLVLPWIATRWGAMRLHPLEQFDPLRPRLLGADIDFHWNHVRVRPEAASDATDFVTGRLDAELGGELDDGEHPLSTGGVSFFGTANQIEKKFEKFCLQVERGVLDEFFTCGAYDILLDQHPDAAETLDRQGTSVDRLLELRFEQPALSFELNAAATRLSASRSPQNQSEFTRIMSKVTEEFASRCLMRYQPSESSTNLACAVRDLIQEGNIAAMTIPVASRESPWSEVLAAEAGADAATGTTQSEWTDDHWLQASWGALRLRFSTTDGCVTAGSAQFLFREARYDPECAKMMRLAAQALAIRYPLLPAHWPEHGTPVFMLGVNGSVDEDLEHLAAMISNCYLEDVLYSTTVREGILSPLSDSYGAGFLDFIVRQAPNSLQAKCMP